ncbi:uncharacterized protein EI97DRAFT_70274 [Westerdykella ornata]|uniref:Protein kinase domain-containing protein n=1 Tax=Westerdykella ornata TaxID=318751 RepID=A0A6A6JJ71_WESOR|nr:uncharacterized protein EI97DRAFT_70274 [Westerdykella ornata]KAF2275716.1 hypothetical protein EI97DRAFT_70274 [Westerdykella ornata]
MPMSNPPMPQGPFPEVLRSKFIPIKPVDPRRTTNMWYCFLRSEFRANDPVVRSVLLHSRKSCYLVRRVRLIKVHEQKTSFEREVYALKKLKEALESPDEEYTHNVVGHYSWNAYYVGSKYRSDSATERFAAPGPPVYWILLDTAPGGISLEAYIQECGLLPAFFVWDTFVEVADALQFIHRSFVVHGHVQPSKVLVNYISSAHEKAHLHIRPRLLLIDFKRSYVKGEQVAQSTTQDWAGLVRKDWVDFFETIWACAQGADWRKPPEQQATPNERAATWSKLSEHAKAGRHPWGDGEAWEPLDQKHLHDLYTAKREAKSWSVSILEKQIFGLYEEFERKLNDEPYLDNCMCLLGKWKSIIKTGVTRDEMVAALSTQMFGRGRGQT